MTQQTRFTEIPRLGWWGLVRDRLPYARHHPSAQPIRVDCRPLWMIPSDKAIWMQVAQDAVSNAAEPAVSSAHRAADAEGRVQILR